MRIFAPLATCGLCVFLTAAPVAAQGRIYKWVDANGRVHYSDAPVGQAEDVDAALPPASSFGTLPAPEGAESPPPADDTPSLPTAPPSPPESDFSSPPAAESPPVASLPEEEPGVIPPAAGEESPPAAGEPAGRGAVGPAGEETAEPTDSEVGETASSAPDSFNFTAFDDFVPGGLGGGEAPDEGSLAAEGVDGAAEDPGEEEAE